MTSYQMSMRERMNWLEFTLWVLGLWLVSSVIGVLLFGWWVKRGRRRP